MKRNAQNMLQGPLASSILLYTIPIILTSLLQLLFNAADLVVVGRFCGSISVAAVGSTGAITNLIVNLFIGLSVGAGVTVAHGIGSREEGAVHRTVHTALPTAIVGGIFLTVVGVAFSEPILKMMGTPENVLPLSAIYMKVYFLGMTFNMVYNFSAAILRAAGDTRSPLVILTAAGIINVILNIIFVTAVDMNVAGVALATTISQACSAVAVVIVLMRREDDCRLRLRQMRFYTPQLLKMIRIGLPAGIQSSMFSISNVIIQSSINSFGDVMMSANAAVANIEGFEYVTMNGFHQTAVNYVGQNAGAHQFKRVRRVVELCLAYCAGAAVLVCGAVYLFAPSLLSLYITDSPEAIAMGVYRMAFTTLPYIAFGLMDVTTGAMRGIGASFLSMILSVLCICGIRLAWVYTVFQIPRFHTPGYLYTAYIVSWVIGLAAQVTAFLLVYRRLQKASQT